MNKGKAEVVHGSATRACMIFSALVVPLVEMRAAMDGTTHMTAICASRQEQSWQWFMFTAIYRFASHSGMVHGVAESWLKFETC